MEQTDIRPAVLSGTWYQANPQQLYKETAGYIRSASAPENPGEVVGLLAPHAGHRYSGPVAGHAFRAIKGKTYETIAIISPYHYGHQEPLLSSPHYSYTTPLGQILIDKESQRDLDLRLKEDGEKLIPIPNDQEHSIEIELPFLQAALEDRFKLLPVMIANTLSQTAYTLGAALAETLKDKNALLIASTDLSHFFPERVAHQLDEAMLDAIASFDPKAVFEVQRSGKGQACGLLPVMAVMTAAKALGANQAQILRYDTSATVSGDYSRVVGYGAGIFTRQIISETID